MQAIRAGAAPQEVFDATKIDPWFVRPALSSSRRSPSETWPPRRELTADLLAEAKRHGFSDQQVAEIRGLRQDVAFRQVRHALGVRPVYKTVDTCAAEFAANTPASFDPPPTTRRPRSPRARSPPSIILGSGPNRIGQGIEFDYSCVHASFALSPTPGYETVMVNCNPETVSTDYDTSDRLYFEPLTLEDVLEIVHAERQAGPVAGVVVQLGGQTPLGLCAGAEGQRRADRRHVPRGHPRGRGPGRLRARARRGRPARPPSTAPPPPSPRPRPSQTRSATRSSSGPSYVLGGRGMEIVYDEARLESYIAESTEISPSRPVLVDRFLDDAIEIDVDALYDGEELYLGGVMEHIEEAGIHSGDSACALPPITLGGFDIKRLRASTEAIARASGCAA
ncbi:carbamoyl-phosphate synthase large subunit [Streptomyces hirsutus]